MLPSETPATPIPLPSETKVDPPLVKTEAPPSPVEVNPPLVETEAPNPVGGGRVYVLLRVNIICVYIIFINRIPHRTFQFSSSV